MCHLVRISQSNNVLSSCMSFLLRWLTILMRSSELVMVEDLDEHLHMAPILPTVFGRSNRRKLIHLVMPKKTFLFLYQIYLNILFKFTCTADNLCSSSSVMKCLALSNFLVCSSRALRFSLLFCTSENNKINKNLPKSILKKLPAYSTNHRRIHPVPLASSPSPSCL